MKKYQFKTNIMCSSCIAKVTPVLNEILGDNQWQVDIKDSKKILTVTSESANEKEVIKALEKVGYEAEEIN
jgi:copper chaperone CopZ